MSRLDLCLFAARVYLHPEEAPTCPELPPAESSDTLFFEISREGFAGFLAMALADMKSCGEFQPKALERLKGETIRNLCWLSELTRLDRALTQADCDALVLKGGALLHHGYQDRLGVRYLSDVDLMVRERELEQVTEILLALGYCSRDGINFFHEDLGLAVDLHTEPIKRVATAFTFSTEQLWRDSLALDARRYARLRRLGREDHYLHLAIHALKHGYERLSWLMDLAVLHDDFDAELLWQKAQASHSERVLAYTFDLLDQLFEVPPVDFFQKRLPRLHRLERVYLSKVALREAPRTLGKLVTLFSIPSWRGRARYLWQIGAPQTAGTSWRERLRQLRRMAIEAIRAFRSVR